MSRRQDTLCPANVRLTFAPRHLQLETEVRRLDHRMIVNHIEVTIQLPIAGGDHMHRKAHSSPDHSLKGYGFRPRLRDSGGLDGLSNALLP